MRILNMGSLRKARQKEEQIAEVPTATQANEDKLAWKLRWTSSSSDVTVCNIYEHWLYLLIS